MLTYIRKSSIGIILAFVFTLSLFFFRSGERFSGIFGVGANDVARVGIVDISAVQFLRTFDLTVNRLNEAIGSQITNEEAKAFGLDNQALSVLINEAIFLNEFEDIKLLIDDTVIAKITKDYIPSIYDQNNMIIEENLNAFLRNQNLNLEDLIKIIKSQALRDLYDKSLIDNISYPNTALNKINIYDSQIRDVEFLKLPINKIKIDLKIDDNKVKIFYENNINLFTEPEKRTIEYISITPKQYINKWKINEQEIINYYNNNKNLFLEEEKRSFIQLNFVEKKEAENFISKLDNQLTYEGLKRLANEENINYIEYEIVDNKNIINEISQVVFKQNINEVSKLIISPLAYHISMVKEIKPEYLASFKGLQKSILEKLKNEKSNTYIQEMIEKIDEDILNNMSIYEISKRYQLNIEELYEVQNLNSNNIDNQKSIIINNAFDEQINITSDLHDGIIDGSYYLFNVSNIINSKPKNYNLIKNEVIKKWKEEETKIKASEYINNLLNKEKKITIKQLSKQYNIDSKIIKTSINNKELSRSLITKIFESNINKINQYYENKNFYIYVTNSITLPKNINNSVNNNINGDISLEIKNALSKEIAKNIKIKVNDNLINSLTITSR